MDHGSRQIIFCGYLEKKRDGAVRGGWASRLFILTPTALHYFRKVGESELLGEERGQIMLSSIVNIQAKPEDSVPNSAIEFGLEHYYLEIIADNRQYLMRVPLKEASTCESWSIAIEEQRKALAAIKQNGDASSPNLASPRLLARNHELYARFAASPPQIAMVSIVTIQEPELKQVELVISRHVSWGDPLNLGVISHGGACVLLMRNGGVGRIGTQALMGSWDASDTCWIEIADAPLLTEVEVSAVCTVRKRCKSESKARREALLPENSRWLERLDEGTSFGFLVMCLFVHLLYGVDGFHWSHKCCLTVGAALAISTILVGSGSKKPLPTVSTPKSTITSLPALEFTLTVHRCRVKTEGFDYTYSDDIKRPLFVTS